MSNTYPPTGDAQKIGCRHRDAASYSLDETISFHMYIAPQIDESHYTLIHDKLKTVD